MWTFSIPLFKQNKSAQNSNDFLPFDNASVNKRLDDVKRAAEVTAKDWFEVVFAPASPSVRADVFPTVGTKWKPHVKMRLVEIN